MRHDHDESESEKEKMKMELYKCEGWGMGGGREFSLPVPDNGIRERSQDTVFCYFYERYCAVLRIHNLIKQKKIRLEDGKEKQALC